MPEDQNPWTMQKIENLDNWPERHLNRVILSVLAGVYIFRVTTPPGMSIGHFGRFPKVLVFLAKLVLNAQLCNKTPEQLSTVFYSSYWNSVSVNSESPQITLASLRL